MRNGVPFSVIFPGITELLPHERIAMGVVMSELDGNKFNWNTMQYEEVT